MSPWWRSLCVSRHRAARNHTPGGGGVTPDFLRILGSVGTVNHLVKFAAALVVIDVADRGARKLKVAAYLLEKTLVGWSLCFQRLNALYDERPQFRISLLGLQVHALRDWPAKYFIP